MDALKHDLTKHDAKKPTCTENGWEEYETCSRCDYTTFKEIVTEGHKYDTKVTDPTCTEEGYTTYTCAGCGDSYEADKVASNGHGVIHVEAKEATVDEAGNIEYWYCETCGDVWTDEACTQSSTLEAVTLPKLDAPATDPENPGTGDSDLIVLMGALTVLSMLAVVALLTKKNYFINK